MMCCEMETIRHPLEESWKEEKKEGRKEEGKGAWFLGLFPLLKSTELHFGKDRQRPRSRILAQSYKMKKLLYPQMLRTISLGCRKK